MTTETPIPGNTPGLPKKTLGECQHEAVLLKGMLEAIDYLANESRCRSGQDALIIIANQRAGQLAVDLDRLPEGEATS